MEYNKIERDFIIRSYENLQKYLILHREDPEQYPYENTQTINSLLGILAFPYQTQRDILQRLDVLELTTRMFCTDGRTPKNFFRHLRNAICHCHFTAKSDEHTKEITAITFFDKDGEGNGNKNFEIELKVKEMQTLIDSIYNAVIPNENN